MKFPILCLLLTIHSWAYTQSEGFFNVEYGNIHFVSEAPLELIEASSDALKGLIDPNKNTFAFAISISSFLGFNSPLQQEHFNEKYMQSEVFPKATFAGKFIEEVDFSKDGTYEVRVKGKLNIHGVEQERILNGRLEIENGNILVNSEFIVPLSDHEINIPRIVNQKIAKEIRVDIKATLLKK